MRVHSEQPEVKHVKSQLVEGKGTGDDDAPRLSCFKCQYEDCE